MYGKDEMDDGADSKMSSLKDLICEMKKLQAEGFSGKPKAIEIEMHSEHELPDGEEEMDEESPEHEMEESPEEESEEHEHEMEIPPGLLRLLAEKLAK